MRSFALFTSVAGTWLPFLLIFTATWITGFLMSTMPWPKDTDTPPVRRVATESHEAAMTCAPPWAARSRFVEPTPRWHADAGHQCMARPPRGIPPWWGQVALEGVEELTGLAGAGEVAVVLDDWRSTEAARARSPRTSRGATRR